MAGVRRLQKEYREILENPISSFSVAPKSESDIFKWEAKIQGPIGSAYEGGVFVLDIHFPNEYPFKAPKCNFKTKIFHPNINTNGAICLDILGQKWSPVLTISKVLLSISSLLTDPNPDDPLVSEIATIYKRDPVLFTQTAKTWTQKYAI